MSLRKVRRDKYIWYFLIGVLWKVFYRSSCKVGEPLWMWESRYFLYIPLKIRTWHELYNDTDTLVLRLCTVHQNDWNMRYDNQNIAKCQGSLEYGPHPTSWPCKSHWVNSFQHTSRSIPSQYPDCQLLVCCSDDSSRGISFIFLRYLEAAFTFILLRFYKHPSNGIMECPSSIS